MLFGETTKERPQPEYQDYFIAAVPNASFIKKAFSTLCSIISTGDMQYKNIKKAAMIREDVLSTYVPRITKLLFQYLVDTYSPAWYSIGIKSVDVSQFVTVECRDNLI